MNTGSYRCTTPDRPRPRPAEPAVERQYLDTYTDDLAELDRSTRAIFNEPRRFSVTKTSLPTCRRLRAVLREAQRSDNGGLGFHMWGTIVDRNGLVLAIAYTGEHLGDQWPSSRIISAQKANAANGLSLRCARTLDGESLFCSAARRDAVRTRGHESG